MRWKFPASALAAVCAAATSAYAQSSPHDICVVRPPSFTTTEANRLSCEALDKLRQTHTLVYIRGNKLAPHCENRYTVPPDRGDGSFSVLCEVRCQTRGPSVGHSWVPCTSPTGTSAPGARTTGISNCANGVVCTRALRVRNEAEYCASYHRQGEQYATSWVRGGRSCAEGDVSFVR